MTRNVIAFFSTSEHKKGRDAGDLLTTFFQAIEVGYEARKQLFDRSFLAAPIGRKPAFAAGGDARHNPSGYRL
jgi:hypothetical protein